MTYPGSGGQWQSGQWPTSAYPVYYPPQGPPLGSTQPPPRRSRRGLVLGIVIAIVVVAGGTAATVWALNRGTQAGSPTPQAAVAKLASDVSHGDVLGIQSDVVPAEAVALKDVATDATNQTKRLKITNPAYGPQSPSVDATAGLTGSGLTFDDGAAQTINDHLVINKLVSGSITISPKLDGSMFTQQFLHSAFPNGVPRQHPDTIDIADVVHRTGQPVRIATTKVDGGWYTSVFYTAADYALESARRPWPTTSLPATGASSPDAAAAQFVRALLRADYRTAIELTDPNEMAVLHDAGPALLDALHAPKPTGITVQDISFADRPVTGGVDAVLRGATLAQGADTLVLSQQNGCYAVTDQGTGDQRKLCAGDFAEQAPDLANLPPEVATALQHLTSGVLSTGPGLVSTKVDGKWYVSPVRSVGALLVAMVSGLRPEDITALGELGGGH